MSTIGTLGVIGLVVIVLALLGWVFMIVRANKDPAQNKKQPGKPKRGPVSGGVIRGDPGQSILTGEAPRQDERPKNGPLDL
jgi:hypothetical protein